MVPEPFDNTVTMIAVLAREFHSIIQPIILTKAYRALFPHRGAEHDRHPPKNIHREPHRHIVEAAEGIIVQGELRGETNQLGVARVRA